MSHRVRFVVALAAGLALIGASAPVASAQTPNPAASANATPEQIAAWHTEIDRATAQHASAVKTEAIGIGVFLGGIGLMGYSVVCDRCNGTVPFVGGLIVSIAGAVAADAGHGRAHDGSLTRSWLESHGPATLSSPAWRSEFDQQIGKKSTGHKTRLAGFLIAGTGLLMARQVCTSGFPSRCSHARLAFGQSLLLGGAVVGSVGSQMAHDADLTMKLLHAHAPAGPMSLSMVPDDAGSGLSVSVGRATSVGWRLRW